jgi:outer membrane protein OmpA-like peptidoglycan-associated protein
MPKGRAGDYYSNAKAELNTVFLDLVGRGRLRLETRRIAMLTKTMPAVALVFADAPHLQQLKVAGMSASHTSTRTCGAIAHAAATPPVALRYAALLFCGLALAASAAPAWAEEPTVDEMVCALNPQCKTPVVDRRLRGTNATATMHALGSFDRTVNFAFDSDELTADARKELHEVAKCLTDPRTINISIVINGHTDAVGSVDYNQGLSERRAEAVRQYLITQHGIAPSRLAAKGYGKSQPLLPSDPTNGLNRRVSFLNPNYTMSSAPIPESVPADDSL